MAFRAVLQGFRENPEARRLALVFAVVYFAQGMWYLPNLSLTFLLKETFHLSAGQNADFFAITIIPWLIKPVYGLISDSGHTGSGWLMSTIDISEPQCIISHTWTTNFLELSWPI